MGIIVASSAAIALVSHYTAGAILLRYGRRAVECAQASGWREKELLCVCQKRISGSPGMSPRGRERSFQLLTLTDTGLGLVPCPCLVLLYSSPQGVRLWRLSCAQPTGVLSCVLQAAAGEDVCFKCRWGRPERRIGARHRRGSASPEVIRLCPRDQLLCTAKTELSLGSPCGGAVLRCICRY